MNDELLKIMGGIPDSIPSLITRKKIAFSIFFLYQYLRLDYYNCDLLFMTRCVPSVFRHVWSWTSRADRRMPHGEWQCRRFDLLRWSRQAGVHSTVCRISVSDRTTDNYIDFNNTGDSYNSTTIHDCHFPHQCRSSGFFGSGRVPPTANGDPQYRSGN